MKFSCCLLIFLGALLLSVSSQAQTCTPYTIYKEDFGGDISSPSIGQPLSIGITSYIFTKDIPINDGYYSLRKQVEGHKGTWHQIKDHTGDGYMMVVNASYDPGLFYQKTITGLCQGTSFEFSAWVANLMKLGASGKKDPSLKFVIKDPDVDTVIATESTGLLPRYAAPTWEKYSIHFDLPQGLSSVILQIFNNAEGGNGNDLVLDDISFSICGPPMDYNVTGMYNGGTEVCIGKQVNLKASIPNGSYINPQYQWQFSTDENNWSDISGEDQLALNFNNIQAKDSGTYRLIAAEQGNIHSEKCRIVSKPIPIHVWEYPKGDISTNAPACEGTPLHLEVPSNSDYEVQWTGPNHFNSSKDSIKFPSAQLNQSGVYNVKIKNPGGCEVSETKLITIQKNDLQVSLKPADSILCEGESQVLKAGNQGATYLWSTGETIPVIEVDTGGKYSVTVSKGVCSVSDSVQLYSVETPKINLGADTSVCEDQPYQIDATTKGVTDYLWGNGSTDPVLPIQYPGTYEVTLKNHCGTAKDAIHIATEKCANILLFPTAFTPNGDGQNDIFRPKYFISIRHYHLEIYNRWGQKVFQSNDPNAGWDGTYKGKKLPTGAYIWKVRYQRQQNGKDESQKGSILIIR